MRFTHGCLGNVLVHSRGASQRKQIPIPWAMTAAIPAIVGGGPLYGPFITPRMTVRPVAALLDWPRRIGGATARTIGAGTRDC